MKVALFGVWHVHATNYTKTAQSQSELIGFYERDDKIAQSYMAKHPDVYRFKSEEEILSSEAEGIIVCSASCDHARDMINIARAGKNIFTEKVLALTVEECDAIERAVEENGVSLTISFPQKYIASRMAVKEIADSGELGKINYVRFRCAHPGSLLDWLPAHFYDRRQSGGGAMIDLGAHGMYLIEWLLGMPISARSAFTVSCELERVLKMNTDRVEDNAVTVMSFESGAIAVNETGFVSKNAPMILEVRGEEGYVVMENDSVVKCTAATENRRVAVELGESLPSPMEQFLSGNILSGCSIKEGRALTRMMEMAYN